MALEAEFCVKWAQDTPGKIHFDVLLGVGEIFVFLHFKSRHNINGIIIGLRFVDKLYETLS